MRKTASTLVKVASDDNREQTFIKFWHDTFLCQMFQDPQRPPRESWNTYPLYTGWLKLFVARAIARRDLSFIYSLQKGCKQMWPPLGDVKKKAALDKHRGRLSEHRGPLPRDLAETVQNESLRIFGGIEDMRPTKFMPSGSACLQAPLRKGGALSLAVPFVSDEAESAKIGKLPVLAATLNQWRSSEISRFSRLAEDRMTQLTEAGTPAGLDVDVVAIPEPGKFRIITKGDGYLYTALQPLQGLMLDCWKKSDFSTMRHEDLTEKVRAIDESLPSDFLLCSVDYEAATDLLKKDATIEAMRHVIGHNADFALLALMGSGRARYPEGEVVEYTEGQLMGHPLSFPLLCVINLAVYHAAILRWVKAANADEIRDRGQWGELMWNKVIVNGDDMFFKCPRDFYPVFLKTASDAGFKISQGKNYLSPDCAIINSQVFRRIGGHLKRFGYLNLKLIKGNSVKSGESAAIPTQIGREVSKMVSLCYWSGCSVPAAFSRWKEDYHGPGYNPNWYLPVRLGGFGVDRALAPTTWRVTREQRELAARFVSDPKLALYRSQGESIDFRGLQGAIANWRVVPGDYVQRESESTEVRDAWLERLAYADRAGRAGRPLGERKYRCARFSRQYRLKPMSMEGIERYWDAQVFATYLPPCPPLGKLKLPISGPE